MESLLTTTIEAIATFDQRSVLWALIVGIILAFLLGAGMGGNDVANAFGTSVGSGVLTVIQAYILASIFETLGAVLVGCAAWLLMATILKMPVSTTHALVGATLGFSIVLRGFNGIRWMKIVNIVVSWFLSPALSGTISVILYLIVDFAVLRRENPFECGLRALPIFYFVCIAFNVLMVTWDGSKCEFFLNPVKICELFKKKSHYHRDFKKTPVKFLLRFNEIPVWGAFVISIGCGFIAALFVQFFLKPRIHRRIQDETATKPKMQSVMVNTDLETDRYIVGKDAKDVKDLESGICTSKVRSFIDWFLPNGDRIEDPHTIKLFSTIQVFTACFAGFAHGANDVSNAIAPLTALVAIYKDKNARQEGEVPIYILLYGVFAICVGLWTLGHRVIRTVGTNMSEINPATGFTIEFGAAMTALISSKLGLPISTTHCLVGSVVAVGVVKSRENIEWSIFRNIVI
ncbi:phosphate transporter family protein, partial [Oesophagostomum dentatum]